MASYARDSQGTYIPASQRPDGTWRKARRVKDGYVPQEEVPLYESKGKQIMKKPALPPGMCPVEAAKLKQAREKKEKQKQLEQNIPGIIKLNPSGTGSKSEKQIGNASSNANNKRPKANDVAKGKSNESNKSKNITSTKKVTESLAELSVVEDSDEVTKAKLLRKLRKKIREIDTLEEKLNSGQIKVLDQEQRDKITRKAEILKEIEKLECAN